MEALHWYRAGQGRHRRRPPTRRDAAAARPPFEPRRLDGRYRLIELIARGGWSTVWRGYDERLLRPVAIKLLDASQARWVHGEAISLAKLTHAHIATVYDYGYTGTECYLVLEFVEGRSLADALEPGPLPWPDAVRYCAEVASALAAAHRRGLVHRDVAPGNIMLTSSGVKLIDFGLSVVTGESETDGNGEARGTPPYVAPERLTVGVAGPASDVFGLAAVLYRAIAGHTPWQAGSVTELLAVQATTDPAPLPPIAGLPDAVAGACLRCLSRDPHDRPTAAEMADLLAAAAPPTPAASPPSDTVTAAPVSDAPPRSSRPDAPDRGGGSRVLRWVTAAFVVSLLGGLGWVLTGWGPDGAPITSSLVGPGLPQTGCVVAYQLTSVPGQPFAATVTITNTGSPLAPGWRLSYAAPAGAGPDVGATASEPGAPLEHGGSVQLSLAAAAPAAGTGTFTVNGLRCLAVPFPFTGTPDPFTGTPDPFTGTPDPAVPAGPTATVDPLVPVTRPDPAAPPAAGPGRSGPKATRPAHGSAGDDQGGGQSILRGARPTA